MDWKLELKNGLENRTQEFVWKLELKNGLETRTQEWTGN